MSRKPRAIDDLAADIQDHIARETEDNIARGMSEVEARRKAKLRFGNATLVAEDVRGVWRPGSWFALRELRHAVRRLLRAPWYTTASVGVLALGMTLTTTVFAVVDGALFNPLPYPRAAEIVGFSPGASTGPIRPPGLWPASAADLRTWQAAVPEVTFAGYNASGTTLALGGEPVELAQVDRNFLDVLGQQALIGGFRPEHFGPRDDVWHVLISYRLWQARFAGERSVVGRSFANQVQLGQKPSRAEIVGVLPPEFLFPAPSGTFKPEILVSIPPPPPELARVGGGTYLYVIARVPESMPMRDVEDRVTHAAQELAKTFPPSPPNRPRLDRFDAVKVVPLREALTWNTRTIFAAAFVCAAVLMLLACLNFAGLAGARVQDRHYELALRRAMGASRGHLLRLVSVENAVPVVVAVAIGIPLAAFLLTTLKAVLPTYVFLKPPAIDVRVVVFCVLAAVLSGAVVTAWTSRFIAGGKLQSSLAENRTSRRAHSTGRKLLLTLQVAATFVLMLGGTLFTLSLAQAWQEDSGVVTEDAYRIDLANRSLQDIPTINRLVGAVRAVKGVTGAGGLAHGFLQQSFNGSEFDAPPGINDRGIESLPVSAGFFAAAGINAVSGRLPTDEELATGASVVVVSRRAATRYWPDQPTIGQELVLNGRAFSVVGIVQDVRYRSLDIEPNGEVYWSIAARPRPGLWNLYVRVAPREHAALGAILDVIARDFQAYRVNRLMTADESYGDGLRQRRFHAWLFGSFGAASLAIVTVGILGLLATIVVRRTREIGIRMALGSTRRRVVGLLLREQLMTVGLGLATGLAGAAWAVPFVSATLYRVRGNDIRIWALAAATIVLAAAIGTVIPALTASKIDPTTALKTE